MDKRGKGLIGVSLAAIAMVLFISFLIIALSGETNQKTYDSETKTVTIKNVSDESVAEIQLISPQNNYVIRGEDRLVAEFTITSYVNYDAPFNDLKFYNIKDSMNQVEREFTYKSKSYENKTIPVYEEVCELDPESENESIICTTVQNGTKVIQQQIWNDFNEEGELSAGKTTIGIFTEVYPNENIEWIPTLFGVEINEWASWNESLNINLAAYYKFEDNFLNSVTSAKYNLTANGTPVFVDGSKIGKGVYVATGGNGFKPMEMNAAYDLFQPNRSANVWIWPNESMNYFWWALYDEYYIILESGMFQLYNVGTRTITAPLTIGDWSMLTITVNDTHVSMYKNGTKTDCAPRTTGKSATQFYWGTINFNGTYDEMSFWNRTLDDGACAIGAVCGGEISQLWNNGDGITYIKVDTTPPNVTINTPANTTYSTNSITFNVTATDETEVSSCWYSVNSGTTNYTMSNSTYIDDYTHINSSISDGTYTSKFYCNDSSNNINNSEQVTFTVNTPPTIPVLLSPANNSGFAMESTITFVWNNSTDASQDTITYDLEIYNESDMAASHLIYSNVSFPEEAGNTSITIKLSDYTLVDDDYYWRVRANDSLSGSNWSETRQFQYANWTIVFNLTDSYTGQQIDTSSPQDSFDISCSNGFIIANVENPYTATNKFSPGTWECNFSGLNSYYTETYDIISDNDKEVIISMSKIEGLTGEEHTWLEAIYNCIIGQDCSLYNLLLEINSTVGNIWEQSKPTDESVITSETITNKVVNSTNNLTIDYTVNIPIKAGYVSGTYLPIRIGYWFLNESNITCYNQGDKPTGVEEPYCQPLVIETIGPMGGSVSFTVKLRPELPAGNYSIKRIIDIDPNNVWTNYGQEAIGKFIMAESLIDSVAGLDKTGETMPSSGSTPSSNTGGGGGGEDNSVTNVYNTYITKTGENEKEKANTNSNKDSNDNQISKETEKASAGITGAVIGGFQRLLSGKQIIFIITILCGTFIIFIIFRYKITIRVKKKQ